MQVNQIFLFGWSLLNGKSFPKATKLSDPDFKKCLQSENDRVPRRLNALDNLLYSIQWDKNN